MFETLEEEGGENGMHRKPENYHIEKDKEDNMEIIQEQNGLKEDPPSTMELGRDHEMTLSEGGT